MLLIIAEINITTITETKNKNFKKINLDSIVLFKIITHNHIKGFLINR